ncbi:esterase-like activity of phytase family protein [Pontixanthobacter gangjinensis]|uniref:Esterase-like activity of phytase family protein n=1 Tax=Pontixanthobacter gangjinensis TaxID=1028742 RepID=A0A6I4SJB8_9SPHN|nr:esterase-like activity of phytase family protein [Pontixanthobacter gangjinensis]MXO55765.1 esterase-like activity of phytase family protein [Pontixanthobacter gangjinensis]
MRKLLLLAFVAACLTPGTWVRSPVPRWSHSQDLSVTKLDAEQTAFGELQFRGAWQLDSQNTGFGGYSALLGHRDDRLFAASDSGGVLQFPKPGAAGDVQIRRFAGRGARRKNLIDIESLTRDPSSGQIWAGYEGTNSIERLNADLTGAKAVRPAAMSGWRSNAGPEAMVRLADGRFIVLSEGPRRWLGDAYPALLFPADPVSGAMPLQFVFESAGGFAPVDMVQIPDGRVLVLVRDFSLGLPPTFAVKLVLVDPAEIANNAAWAGRILGEINTSDLQDNYEGMIVEPGPEGMLDIWLISDDNNATFQRTLLLNLRWDPA